MKRISSSFKRNKKSKSDCGRFIDLRSWRVSTSVIKKSELGKENVKALEAGFTNLRRHIENINAFGWNLVISLNRYSSDTQAEISALKQLCSTLGVDCVITDAHANGSDGSIDLANALLSRIDEKKPTFAYPLDMGLRDKIETLAGKIYRAGTVALTPQARKDIAQWERLGYGNLPVCVAKTQYSFSDAPKLLGAPEGFEMTISEVRLSAGAGFVIPMCGDITLMPGLPRKPSAELIDMNEKGDIIGLS